MAMRLRNLGKVPFAPVVAPLFGAVTAILVMMTPLWLFEHGVSASGLPSLLSAAQPPLGDTARLLAALIGGIGVGALLWTVLAIIRGIIKRNAPAKAQGSRIDPVTPIVSPRTSEGVGVTARREPIFADRDLGAPFMSDEAIAATTIITVPIAPSVPVAPVQSEIAPVRHIAAAKVVNVPHMTHDRESISALMTRLEAALKRREKRGFEGKPLAAGDIASLRKALGVLG